MRRHDVSRPEILAEASSEKYVIKLTADELEEQKNQFLDNTLGADHNFFDTNGSSSGCEDLEKEMLESENKTGSESSGQGSSNLSQALIQSLMKAQDIKSNSKEDEVVDVGGEEGDDHAGAEAQLVTDDGQG